MHAGLTCAGHWVPPIPRSASSSQTQASVRCVTSLLGPPLVPPQVCAPGASPASRPAAQAAGQSQCGYSVGKCGRLQANRTPFQDSSLPCNLLTNTTCPDHVHMHFCMILTHTHTTCTATPSRQHCHPPHTFNTTCPQHVYSHNRTIPTHNPRRMHPPFRLHDNTVTHPTPPTPPAPPSMP